MTDQTEDDGPVSVAAGAAAAPVTQKPVAILTQVHKTYHLDSIEVPVIKGVDILVRHAKFTVLSGPSGSGKTTLLNMLGCIDKPDQGEIIVADANVGTMAYSRQRNILPF